MNLKQGQSKSTNSQRTEKIVKKDSETGTAQGDGTLSGAVYGIFNGEDSIWH